MNNKTKLFLFLIPALLFVGCDIDENLVGDFSERPEDETQFGTGPDPCAAGTVDGQDGIQHLWLGSAYSTLFNAGTANHDNYWSVQAVSSDEMAIPAKGGDWFDGGIWVDMHRHDYAATSGPLNNAFGTQYDQIAEINDLLSTETNDQYIAELRVLRAFYYYKLMDAFGRVKIVTTLGVDAPQSSRADVYTFVVDELNAALNSGNLLDAAPNNAMITSHATRGLLARVYLNAEVYAGTAEYDEVITLTDAIINSGNYNLAADYADLFAPDNSQNTSNTENIWVVPYDQTTGPNMNFAQMTLHYGSQLTFNLAEQPWNGYAALEEFYNSYDNSDERKANNFLVGPQTDTDGNPVIDFASETTDPDIQLNYRPAINEVFPNANRDGGARLFKFNFAQCQRPNMNNDYPLMRYADVLLMKAEAEAREAGDWNNATARGLVNQIRARAGLTDLATLTEAEFLAERGREMFMESTRRSDLIRFGQWGAAWWEKDAHTDANLNIFPIPLDQINASQSAQFQLTQNPGY